MRLQRRPRTALGLVKKSPKKVVARCREFYNAVTTNKTTFATPNPAPATFLGAIQAVETAIAAVPGGAPGASANVGVKVAALILLAESLQHYVQGLADAAPTPDAAVNIIQSAAMKVAAFGSRASAPLRVTPILPAGSVGLRAVASALIEGRPKKGSRTFHWYYSLDGGKTWLFGAATPRARATLSGLPLLTEIAFRVRVSYGKGGESDWCPRVTLVLN
jgi:hypothetical protein